MKLSEVTGSEPSKTDKPTRLSDVTAPSFSEGFGTGLMDKVYGALQLGSRAPVVPEALPFMSPEDLEAANAAPKAVDEKIRQREKTLEAEGYNKGWGRTVGGIAGDIGITAPLAFLMPEAPAATMLGRVGQAALTGAAGGALTGAVQPVTQGDFAAEKAKQVIGGGITGAVVGAPFGALSKALVSDSPAEVESFIKGNYQRAIKPTVAGKATASQLDSYMQQARSAIGSIVENKPNLRFSADGTEVVGELPKSIEQFGEAIEQTKGNIFRQYDALAQQAGDQGAKVPLDQTIQELRKLSADTVVQDLHPELAAYAQNVADRLAARGEYTTTDAQRAVQNLNATLKSFYQNPSYETASRASVDSLVANQLRAGLDNAIENAVAPGYQALKNQYGALKSIEKDVVHRAIVEGRKNTGGGILGRIADVASAEEVLRGLMTMRPGAVMTGAALKGWSSYVKWLRDPNRAVRRLFEAAEETPQVPSKSAVAATNVLPAVFGGMVGDAVSGLGLR